LAVGDLEFQAQCLHRIQQMRRAGVTIVYVSHDVESVRSLSDLVLLLERGRVVDVGDPGRVCDRYYRLIAERAAATQTPPSIQAASDGPKAAVDGRWVANHELDARPRVDSAGSGAARVRGVALLDSAGEPVCVAQFDERATIRVSVECLAPLGPDAALEVVIRDCHGLPVSGASAYRPANPLGPRLAGERVVVDFGLRLPLRAGKYTLAIGVLSDHVRRLYADKVEQALTFEVGDPPRSVGFEGPVYLQPLIDVAPPPSVTPPAPVGGDERRQPVGPNRA
jgi:hypothetical protein